MAYNEKAVAGQRMMYDTFKHLTTLSTGSILLLATFLRDVFKAPEWSSLIGIVFVMFIISMTSSIVVMIMIGAIGAISVGNSKEDNVGITVLSVSSVTTAGSFLVGMIILVVFVMKNFY